MLPLLDCWVTQVLTHSWQWSFSFPVIANVQMRMNDLVLTLRMFASEGNVPHHSVCDRDNPSMWLPQELWERCVTKDDRSEARRLLLLGISQTKDMDGFCIAWCGEKNWIRTEGQRIDGGHPERTRMMQDEWLTVDTYRRTPRRNSKSRVPSTALWIRMTVP